MSERSVIVGGSYQGQEYRVTIPTPTPYWKYAVAGIWIAAVIGGAVYYAYWQGHFNALHLANCAI